MATDAILGLGAVLEHSIDGGTVWVEMVDMMEIGSPGSGEFEKVEIPAVKVAGNTKQYLLALKDAGEWEFKQYYKKDRYAAAKALVNVPGVKWRITLSDGSKDVIDGLLSQARLSAISQKAPVTIDCKVVVNSDDTFTPAA